MDLKTWIEHISVTNMAYEFCILIRDSGAKPKNTVICLPGMHETLVCAESAHLKKKKSDPKKYPTLEQFLYPLNVGSTCLAVLRFKALFIFRG